MKLTVVERLNLSGMLPEKGSYTNLKLIRLAREALSFTDAEHKLLKFRNEPTGKPGESRSTYNQNLLVEKSTGNTVTGNQEEVMAIVNENPDNYEMRPTVDEVNIKLGEVVTNMIIKILKAQEEKEELEGRYFTLYEKFCSRADLKVVES